MSLCSIGKIKQITSLNIQGNLCKDIFYVKKGLKWIEFRNIFTEKFQYANEINYLRYCPVKNYQSSVLMKTNST